VFPDGKGSAGARIFAESKLPTVIREVPSTTTPRTAAVDEVDRSLNDDPHFVPTCSDNDSYLRSSHAGTDSHLSSSQSIDGNAMLAAVNKIADVC